MNINKPAFWDTKQDIPMGYTAVACDGIVLFNLSSKKSD